MIKTEFVDIRLSERNVKHLKKLHTNIPMTIKNGREIPLYGSYIKIPVVNINRGSDIKIEVLCDVCLISNIETIVSKKFNNFTRDRINNNGIDICGGCARKKAGLKRRIGYQLISNEFINRGLNPLFSDDSEILTNKKLLFECDKHRGIPQYIDYNHLLACDNPCVECRKPFLINRKKKKTSDIIKYFIKRGLTPLANSTEYSTFDSIPFECPSHKGDKQYISYSSLRVTKNGCKKCFNKIGSNSPHWKGGITPLVRNMRSKLSKWKKNCLMDKGYRCEITGLNGKLSVHHIDNFHYILEKSLLNIGIEMKSNLYDYKIDELMSIERELVRLHEICSYSVIIKDLHILFHVIYGKKYNNVNQFNEFKSRYFSGEFDDKLKNNLKSTTINNIGVICH